MPNPTAPDPQVGQPIPRKIGATILLAGLWLSWLTGTFTGSGLSDLMTGAGAPAGEACGVQSQCWWVWFRGPDYADVARVLRTVGYFGITLLIGAACLGRLDRRLLQVSIGLSLVGDVFLVLVPGLYGPMGPETPLWVQKSFLIGVGVFLVAHLVLIARHSVGLRASLSGEGARRVWRWYAGLALFWAACSGGIVVSQWWLMAKLPPFMLVVFLLYIVVLTVGVWAGTTAWLRPAFARDSGPPYVPLNGMLVAVGMICFGITDIALGVEYLYRKGADGAGCWQFISVIKDLNYSPALMFLSYSGFAWGAYSVPTR